MMMLLVGAHDDNAFGWQDVEATQERSSWDCRLGQASQFIRDFKVTTQQQPPKGRLFSFLRAFRFRDLEDLLIPANFSDPLGQSQPVGD